MKLVAVTRSGADDTCDPAALANLVNRIPLLEVGLLLGDAERILRFPSRRWIEEFLGLGGQARAAAHLCGAAAGDFLRSPRVFSDRYGWVLSRVSRIQLSGIEDDVSHLRPEAISFLRELRQTLIVPTTASESALCRELRQNGVRVVACFDVSRGRGQRPDSWPSPITDPFGYAGGLRPETLDAALVAISKTAGDATVWIDLESGLRSGAGSTEVFDLDRVSWTLDVAQAFAARQQEPTREPA